MILSFSYCLISTYIAHGGLWLSRCGLRHDLLLVRRRQQEVGVYFLVRPEDLIVCWHKTRSLTQANKRSSLQVCAHNRFSRLSHCGEVGAYVCKSSCSGVYLCGQ